MQFCYGATKPQQLQIGVPIYVEHWWGIICNFTPILFYFEHLGNEARPLFFHVNQI